MAEQDEPLRSEDEVAVQDAMPDNEAPEPPLPLSADVETELEDAQSPPAAAASADGELLVEGAEDACAAWLAVEGRSEGLAEEQGAEQVNLSSAVGDSGSSSAAEELPQEPLQQSDSSPPHAERTLQREQSSPATTETAEQDTTNITADVRATVSPPMMADAQPATSAPDSQAGSPQQSVPAHLLHDAPADDGTGSEQDGISPAELFQQELSAKLLEVLSQEQLGEQQEEEDEEEEGQEAAQAAGRSDGSGEVTAAAAGTTDNTADGVAPMLKWTMPAQHSSPEGRKGRGSQAASTSPSPGPQSSPSRHRMLPIGSPSHQATSALPVAQAARSTPTRMPPLSRTTSKLATAVGGNAPVTRGRRLSKPSMGEILGAGSKGPGPRAQARGSGAAPKQQLKTAPPPAMGRLPTQLNGANAPPASFPALAGAPSSSLLHWSKRQAGVAGASALPPGYFLPPGMALPPGMLPAGFAMPAAGPASGEPAQHASAPVAEGASDGSAAAGSACEVAASWPPYEGAKLPPLHQEQYSPAIGLIPAVHSAASFSGAASRRTGVPMQSSGQAWQAQPAGYQGPGQAWVPADGVPQQWAGYSGLTEEQQQAMYLQCQAFYQQQQQQYQAQQQCQQDLHPDEPYFLREPVPQVPVALDPLGRPFKVFHGVAARSIRRPERYQGDGRPTWSVK